MGNTHLTDSGSVQSVDRALAILEILAQRGESGVTEIAADLGVHKSTASRLMSALLNRGLVDQVSDRGRYRLGLGLVRLAGSVTSSLDAVSGSRAVTRALASEVGETVNIAVLSDNQVLYVDQVAGPSMVSMRSWLGQSVPTHCTATGKVLTAWLDQPERIAARPTSWKKLAPNTITSGEALEKELEQVRKQGFAIANQEMEADFIAIAAPIRDEHDEVTAALVISGPASRIKSEDFGSIGHIVKLSASKLSGNPNYWRE
jgi:DNA-binding IclR family transcriptional regulator